MRKTEIATGIIACGCIVLAIGAALLVAGIIPQTAFGALSLLYLVCIVLGTAMLGRE